MSSVTRRCRRCNVEYTMVVFNGTIGVNEFVCPDCKDCPDCKGKPIENVNRFDLIDLDD